MCQRGSRLVDVFACQSLSARAKISGRTEATGGAVWIAMLIMRPKQAILRRARRSLARIVVAILCLGIFAPAGADESIPGLKLVRIGSGDINGIYFQLGDLLAKGISGAIWRKEGGPSASNRRLLGVVQSSTGSVSNIRALKLGRLDIAFAQADVSYWASKGSEMFDGERYGGLRTLANLYIESIHLVVSNRIPGHDLSILPRNQLKISMGDSGSGTLFDATLILQAYGLLDSISPVYLHPKQVLERLYTEQIDGFFFISGVPANLVRRALSNGDVRLMPVTGQGVSSLLETHSFFQKSLIPAHVYDTAQDIETVGVGAQLMVDDQMPNSLAKRLCHILWSDEVQKRFVEAHPQAGNFLLSRARSGLAAELHPGAEQCYQELEAK